MKMITVILISVVMTGAALAATPEVDATYFHPAASLYIHGDMTAASNLVVRGLSQYPDDAKLKRLQELIKKQQQQDQKDQDQQKKDQQKQDQQKKDDQKKQGDQKKQDQQKQDDQKKKDDQDKKDQQKQDQHKQDDQQKQDQQKQDQDQQQQQPQRAEEMSPEEARQLLDAMKQEEKNKRMLLQPVMGTPVKVDKDW